MSTALKLNLTQPTDAIADFLASLGDADKAEFRMRMTAVADWRGMIRDFERMHHDQPATAATRAYLNANPSVKKSSLYRWSKSVDAGDYAALVDGRRMNRGGDPSASPEAWSRFRECYLTIHRRSVALCWQIVAAESESAGWQWPSLRTVQKRVKAELPPFEADYFRLGEKEWRRLYEPKIRRDYSQFRSNQYWVGDFHECDVFCRQEIGARSASDGLSSTRNSLLATRNYKIVRPLLSGFVDLRSRMVVGWRIVQRECQDSVLLAFRDGVDRYGPPQHVVIDNGKPYRALGVSGGRPTLHRMADDEDYVRSVFGALNITVHFSIPFNPDSKLIERWFGTLESQFGSTFPTYCGGQKDDRFRAAWKLANDNPELCPTVEEFAEKLSAYIDAYHTTPHTGDGMDGLSPQQAFDRFDPVPRVVVPDGLMDVLTMRTTRPTKVGRFGVRHSHVEYGQSDPRLLRMQGQEVVLRIHPDDASYVLVCDLGGKPLFKAFNNRLALTGVSQDDLAAGMKAKASAKRLAKRVMDGGTAANMRSVADAAIAARLSVAKADQAARATGTDDVDAMPRTITPLKSDWTTSVSVMAETPGRSALRDAVISRDEFSDSDERSEPEAPARVTDIYAEFREVDDD